MRQRERFTIPLGCTGGPIFLCTEHLFNSLLNIILELSNVSGTQYDDTTILNRVHFEIHKRFITVLDPFCKLTISISAPSFSLGAQYLYPPKYTSVICWVNIASKISPSTNIIKLFLCLQNKRNVEVISSFLQSQMSYKSPYIQDKHHIFKTNTIYSRQITIYSRQIISTICIRIISITKNQHNHNHQSPSSPLWSLSFQFLSGVFKRGRNYELKITEDMLYGTADYQQPSPTMSRSYTKVMIMMMMMIMT